MPPSWMIAQRRATQKRKRLLVLSAIVFFVLSLLGVASYLRFEKRSYDGWITVQGSFFIGSARVEEALDAARDWNTLYGCERLVTISPMSTHAAEPGYETIENAGPGWINISPDVRAYDGVAHAMAHACHDDDTPLKEPMKFSDGQIVGYSGSAIKIHNSIEGDTAFRKCEEGIVEWLAAKMPDYQPSSVSSYQRMRQLFEEHFRDVAPQTVVDLRRHNDVPGIVRLFLDLPQGSAVGSQEIERMMQACQLAFDGR